MSELWDILRREFIYIWYYLTVLMEQIVPYYALGIVLGSAVSVFGKRIIHSTVAKMGRMRLGGLGIIAASLLGVASPLCMYGTIPLAASFSEQGVEDDYLAAFMMASVLLNPQLILYSGALGTTAVMIRCISCFLCGCGAGFLVRIFYRNKPFFNFAGFRERNSRDTHPNLLIRFIKNIGRNIRATAPMFLLGILLTALYQRYIPSDLVSRLFGKNEGYGVLMGGNAGRADVHVRRRYDPASDGLAAQRHVSGQRGVLYDHRPRYQTDQSGRYEDCPWCETLRSVHCLCHAVFNGDRLDWSIFCYSFGKGKDNETTHDHDADLCAVHDRLQRYSTRS